MLRDTTLAPSTTTTVGAPERGVPFGRQSSQEYILLLKLPTRLPSFYAA